MCDESEILRTTMKLTGDQREAVKTWRKGLHHSIVSGLPFTSNEEPLPTGLAEWHGGSYLVCESKNDAVIDFILTATKELANGTKTGV